MFRKIRSKYRTRKVYSITWSCPRCGRPFETEAQMTVHWLQCGK